jgi:hypothetical protein
MVRDQGVGDSNPFSPTNSIDDFQNRRESEDYQKDLRTYIRVAGAGCAKNARHTVAAAMLTASTLSSHHVRL